MDTNVIAGPLLLVVLPVAYLYTLSLSSVSANKAFTRRDISAVLCLLALSCAAATFLFHPTVSPRWLSLLVWTVMPGMVAGTAGHRPFLYLVASSVGAALAVVMHGNRTLLDMPPVLGFILIVIVVNVLGTFLLLPLLAVWEHRRKHVGQSQL